VMHKGKLFIIIGHIIVFLVSFIFGGIESIPSINLAFCLCLCAFAFFILDVLIVVLCGIKLFIDIVKEKNFTLLKYVVMWIGLAMLMMMAMGCMLKYIAVC